jgi:isopentenyl diphosphate isomerase/L-lactate dehydrogenase-like FMN-dependent dehydrogenase
MARAVNIADLRQLARERLPRAVFDFVDGGADDEITQRANPQSWADLRLAPRVLVDVAERDSRVSVFGRTISLPVIMGPAGVARSVEPVDGELALARAAARAGSIYVLSTGASVALEDVVDAGDGHVWFQLYVWQSRDITDSLVMRAEAAGCDVLILTVDTPVRGQRERDLHNRLTYPPKIRLRDAREVFRAPRWVANYLRTPTIGFANLAARPNSSVSSAKYMASTMLGPSASVTWDDVLRIRESWPRSFVLKGIVTAQDAATAVGLGVDGIVASNHGGRQLDGLPSSAEILRDIAREVGDRTVLFVDGGIRRGTDVVKAKALGATAVLVARPYLYALGAGGDIALDRMFEIFRNEIDRCLALLGVNRLEDVDEGCLWQPGGPTSAGS